MSESYHLFAFDSTHDAIRAQTLLSGFGAVVMPTLREISASCGMSLRLSDVRADEARQTLIGSGLCGWALYRVRQEGKRLFCEMVFASRRE